MRPVRIGFFGFVLLVACRKVAAPAPAATYAVLNSAIVQDAGPVSAAPSAAPVAAAPLDSVHGTAEPGREPLDPPKVERVHVPKDKPASVVRAPTGTAFRVVFIPGLCSNAQAYLQSFPEAAREHGGIVAIDGDRPCGARGSEFHSFTWSAVLQRSRIDAALAAVGATTPDNGFTLVGYSSGASIAQMIHERWPELFPRLVLIAPPEDPNVERLRKARGVVSMSCRLDVPYRMKAATTRLLAKGIPSIYLEMPGCTHGDVADGERIFGEAFAWLEARS